MKFKNRSVDDLYQQIGKVLNDARNRAVQAVNTAMVQAYWQIGKLIVEHEQKGRERAGYGVSLLKSLSKKLTDNFGVGFDQSNLRYMRGFYLAYSKCDALRHELSWTHYRLLMRLASQEARSFYEIECIKSRWSSRELERQINSLLYERLSLGRDEKRISKLTRKGQDIETPQDLIKDPYVLEFLKIKEHPEMQEKDLERNLLDKLQGFLLELGRGFAFISRQKRITLDGDYFYVDLVFYNILLKFFVLIDLKIGKLTHGDIGQMDFYVRYFEKEERQTGDNPTIGLILCSDKNNAMVKYTLLSGSRRIFASKYKFYLPSENELKRELCSERQKIDMKNTLRVS